MKKCEDMERKLTAYLEGFLSLKDKGLVEEHLRDCPDCARALDDLKRTKAMIKGLDDIEPPPWLATKIMSRINEESEAKEGLFRKLFFPLHIKIPVQALAAVCVVALSVLVYRSTMPDMKSIQHKLPEAQVSTQRPVDAGGTAQRSSVSKVPPVKNGRRDIAKKDGPGRETAAVEGQNERLRVQPSPQRSSASQKDTGLNLTEKEGGGNAARHPETHGAKTAAPEDQIKSAPYAPKAESPPAAKMIFEKNIGAGVMMKEDEAKKRVVTRSARSVPTQPPRYRIAILSDMPSKTSRMAIEILHSLGSKDINETRQGGTTVVTCDIDRRDIDVLVEKLKKIGTTQDGHAPIDTPTGRLLVEILISNTGEDPNRPRD